MTRPRRWAIRVAGIVSTLAAMALLQVQAALADPGGSNPLGQTPPALAWIQLKDSHGIPLWNFEMSLDRGGITAPDKFFWASVVDACWGAYRSYCALALWFLDWVMSFDWMHVVAAPLLSIGTALQSAVDRVGAVPTMLTITAIVAVLWMVRGRYATGIWELAVSLVIAALAAGVFAQPVQLVAGDHGLVMKAQQTGLELAGDLAAGAHGGSSDPDQLRTKMTGQLVDTFIRQPTQLINFGRVLDGGKCEKAYNAAVAKGPSGLESTIRDKVNSCDSKLGDYASQPSTGMALGSIVLYPASLVILLVAVVLAGSVIAAACYAMFQSLKAIVTLVTGLLPGGSRGSLFLTVSETAISLLVIVFTNVFLGVFLMVIQAMFRNTADSSVPRTFMIVDVVLIVGVVVYLRYKARLKESAQRIAQWMSSRPGAPAGRMPGRVAGGIGPMASRAMALATTVAAVRTRRAVANGRGAAGPTYIDARRQTVGIFGAGAAGDSGPVPVDLTVDPPDSGPAPTGPRTPVGPGPAGSPALPAGRRPGPLVGALARAGAKAALAYATGGASTAVTGAARAGRALNTARRAAVAARLALPAGPSASPAISAPHRPARPLPASPRTPLLPASPGSSTRILTGAAPQNTAAAAAAATAPPRAATASRQEPTPRRTPGSSPATPTAAAPPRQPTETAARLAPPAVSRRSPDRARGDTDRLRRQWDKVIVDGQVVLIPRSPTDDPTAETPAVSRTRPPGRSR